MDSYREIYPQLPIKETGENFRLKQCSDWLSLLEKDLHDCEKVYKKYKRARSYLFNLSTGSGTLSVAVGAVCALTSVATASLAKIISKKVSKHEKTVSVCQGKINTVKDVVSKALTNDSISHEEFLLVKSECEKYYEMKRLIREKNKDQPPPPQPQVDLKKMEEEIRSEMLKKLARSE